MDRPLPEGFTCQPWGLLGARQTFPRSKGTQEGEAWVPVHMVYVQAPGEIKDMVICAPWSGDGEIFHLTPCVHANSLQSCLTLCDPMDCSPSGPCPWDSPGKNTRVGCHALLQGHLTPVLRKRALKASKGWEGLEIPLQV